MGTRSTKICDVCKNELPFDGMFPKFRVGKVEIQISKAGWGDYEWLANFKGELCDPCVAIINRAAEAFHRELSQRLQKAAPGERVSSADAEPVVLPKKKRKRKRTRP